MTKLQNNFTTPKQSKRLLELGVPADSADCIHIDVPTGYTRFLESKETVEYVKEMLRESYRFEVNVIPIWSVGRLIEIYRQFVFSVELLGTLVLNDDIIEAIVSSMEVSVNKCNINFSKLEE